MSAAAHSLQIPSPSGFLEGLLEIPADYRGKWGAVLSHSHPLYGGTMHNKVVVARESMMNPGVWLN